MCALAPTFSSKQQEWYYGSTMEYYPFLQIQQVDDFSSPTLQYLPSFLHPESFTQTVDETKNFNINHHHVSLSHSNGGANSNSNNDQEEDGGTVLEKKLNHNANERDRRKKLNALYSSLRALLPPSDQKRKLSIPMTVSRVVKYIPEQKQELQRLSRRKEELLKRIFKKTEQLRHREMMEPLDSSSSQRIAATWLTDTEIALQVATSSYTSISDMLLRLEANGFDVINVSSSVSSTARIFYTLHIQMRGDCRVRLEELNDMLFGLRQSY